MNNTYEALIEIPAGSSNKFEYDKDSNRIKLDRVLYGAMFYPADYGYFENTLALDGDPADVLVLTTYPLPAGCLVDVRIIGMLNMIDNGDEDQKIIAVPVADPRFNDYKNIEDINDHKLKEIENFFLRYKDLENKPVELNGWSDASAAINFLEESKARYKG